MFSIAEPRRIELNRLGNRATYRATNLLCLTGEELAGMALKVSDFGEDAATEQGSATVDIATP